MYGAPNPIEKEYLNSSAIQNLAKEINIQNLLKMYEMINENPKFANKIAEKDEEIFEKLENALAKYTCISTEYFDYDQNQIIEQKMPMTRGTATNDEFVPGDRSRTI